MALTMQLTERDLAVEKLKRAQDQELKDKENQIADLTRAHERKLKEKEDQLAVMARAQALSNQRAIAAEAAMNDFLANPLAGMSVYLAARMMQKSNSCKNRLMRTSSSRA